MAEAEMEYLQRICLTCLANADLFGLTVSSDGTISMKFLVAGGKQGLLYWIDIDCRGVHVFNVAKDWEDDFTSGIFVGSATLDKFDNEPTIRTEIYKAGLYVTYEGPLPKQLYQLDIQGGVAIRVICTQLSAQERLEKPAPSHLEHAD